MQFILNGKPHQTNDGICIADLLQSLQLDPRHVAVEVNLQLVPRGEHQQTEIAAGDQLEIVTLVGGG